MAITVKIKQTGSFVDQTNNVMSDVLVSRGITNQVDTAYFSVKNNKVSINNGDEVQILENSTVLFAGTVVKSDQGINGLNITTRYTCKDYSHLMDSVLVARKWANTTVQAVLQDIVDTILPSGFSLSTDVSQSVDNIAFNYELPSQVFKQLAQLVGYDWYVDENKVIQFFSKNEVAPFNLTDDNGNYEFQSLNIQKHIYNLKNSITVIGGRFESTERTDNLETDGEKEVYELPYFYNQITATLGGNPQTIAFYGSDDTSTSDIIFYPSDRRIEFNTKPTTGLVIAITGKPLLPVIINVQDSPSITEFGTYEQKIIDKTIETRELAIQRALAEIESWGDEINTGSFKTKKSGLNVGQKINIQSTARGIDETVLITRIESRAYTPTDFEHVITFATSETVGMVEWLQGLLNAQDKAIDISFEEDIETIRSFKDSAGITDSISTATNTEETAIWGTAICGFSVWGA